MGILYSIVVPAYNEQSRIERTITDLYDFFEGRKGNFEIILVCDGSDHTASIAKRMLKKRSNMRLFTYPTRLGKGGAILEGMAKSRGEFIGFIDADKPIPTDNFYGMLSMLKDADCVIASRNLPESTIEKKAPFMRRVSSRLFSIYVNLLFGLGISDTQCGAKAVRREAYEKIRGSVKSKGFEFDVEVLWRLKQKGIKIAEYPVKWRHEENSKFSLRYGPKMLLSLLKLKFSRD